MNEFSTLVTVFHVIEIFIRGASCQNPNPVHKWQFHHQNYKLFRFNNQFNIVGMISSKIKNRQHMKFHEKYVSGSEVSISFLLLIIVLPLLRLFNYTRLCSYVIKVLLCGTTNHISPILYEGAKCHFELNRLVANHSTNRPLSCIKDDNSIF